MQRRNLIVGRIILSIVIAAILATQVPFHHTKHGVTLEIAKKIEEKEGIRPEYVCFDIEKQEGFLNVVRFSYLVNNERNIKDLKKGCAVFVKHPIWGLYKEKDFFVEDKENKTMPFKFSCTVADTKTVNLVEATNKNINITLIRNIIIIEMFKYIVSIVLLLIAVTIIFNKSRKCNNNSG